MKKNTKLTWLLAILFQALTRLEASFACSSCGRREDAASIFVAKVMWIQLKGKTQRPSWSTISTEASFNDNSNKETLNLN